jgi:hypothetical protein
MVVVVVGPGGGVRGRGQAWGNPRKERGDKIRRCWANGQQADQHPSDR